ncbi:nudix-type nucleoside diphosphatase, YffH/AdpP family [Flaviramulus basaltis]|uniref:GDP-mannose pyrophosphatase n=1 Tax=Flaviramulus basaltis TaxID=369401 RepID=A0A1K2IHM4_9FLAO|nr:NUDIX domain-containing protein [Flaviramulus basaltis]SFZ91736.1 nudix-type nucleoside diphosphatase, YffH/AdpP family [Flaviramulus basaltis]
MEDKLRNIKYNVLSKEWATLYQIDYDYKFENNNWKRLSRESYDRGNGTGILLYNKEKQMVILTKQFRMPAYANTPKDGMSIEVCAGAIDKNENPEVCIIREVEEEVGYKITSAKKVIECYTSPGAVTEKMYLFVAEYNDAMKINAGGGLDIEDEEIEVLEMPFSQALSMIETFEIIDAKTIMLLQYAQIHKLLE